MKINLFEIGRRLTWVLMLIAGIAAFLFMRSLAPPRLDVTFSLPPPPAQAVRTDSCGSGAARTAAIDRVTPKGTRYRLTLCVAPRPSIGTVQTDPMPVEWHPGAADTDWIDRRGDSLNMNRIGLWLTALLGAPLVVWLGSTLIGRACRAMGGIPASRDERS